MLGSPFRKAISQGKSKSGHNKEKTQLSERISISTTRRQNPFDVPKGERWAVYLSAWSRVRNRRTFARFIRFFSLATVSGGTARTILTALLNLSASVSPGTCGGGSL